MLLFGVPDGNVDRFDRAAWLTGPFDLACSVTTLVAGPYRVVAAGTFSSGAVVGDTFRAGAAAGGSFVSGAVIGQVRE